MRKFTLFGLALSLGFAAAMAAAAPPAKTAAKTAAASTTVSHDAAFLKEAAGGGMAEVELGRLAADKASSADVKAFGQRMVDDHSKANSELTSLAGQKGVTVPSDMPADAKAMRDRLSKLSGAQFDSTYMTHMVKDHEKDVAAFEKEASSGKDADVKAWAAKTLPTLKDHLSRAKEIAPKPAAASHAHSH